MTIARKRHPSGLCVFCLGVILLWALPVLCCGEEEWQRFERQVRDEQISYEDGLKEIRHWWGVLQDRLPRRAV